MIVDTRNRFVRRCVMVAMLCLCASSAWAQALVPSAGAVPDPRQVAAEARAGVRQDGRVASEVAALLVRQPSLASVTVDVHAGIVTLSGKVPEEADRARAAALARQVRGVSDVVNAVRLDASLHTRFNAALDQVNGKLIRVLAAAPLLAVAIALVVLACWLGRVVSRRPARWLLKRNNDNPYMEGLVRRVAQALIVLLGVLLALNLLGATALIGAVLGSAGVIGLAFGFAFRDVAENYIAGVLLSLRRPFAPADHVVIDSHEGKVVALTSRSTLLMTLDGNHLSLPNALVFKSVVLNYSVNPKRRFSFVIPIDPAESIRRAQRLAIDAIAAVEGVLTDPAPSWNVDALTPAGIAMTFHGWVDQRRSDTGKVRSEALRAVKSAFATASVLPPRAVQYVINLPPDVSPEADVEHAGAIEPAGACDTSVNRDIDPQLVDAQRATDDANLLDNTTTPAGDTRAL